MRLVVPLVGRYTLDAAIPSLSSPCSPTSSAIVNQESVTSVTNMQCSQKAKRQHTYPGESDASANHNYRCWFDLDYPSHYACDRLSHIC
jgi:hypothetical protein